jgi:hypothetical protein
MRKATGANILGPDAFHNIAMLNGPPLVPHTVLLILIIQPRLKIKYASEINFTRFCYPR